METITHLAAMTTSCGLLGMNLWATQPLYCTWYLFSALG